MKKKIISLLAFSLLLSSASPVWAEVKKQTAIFAGGCFWCMQPAFDHLKNRGVISTSVGYTGGEKDKPTYEEVSSGSTGHRESIEVDFDSAKISYDELLDIFWANVDPTDSRGQFCDKGEQYTSAIFYGSEDQKKLAQASKIKFQKLLKEKIDIVTAILPAKPFFPAEDYHQGYYQKNPIRYKFYRLNCGRDKRLKSVWGQSPEH